MKFYQIWRTYSGVHSGYNCSCISNEIWQNLNSDSKNLVICKS